MVSFVLIGMAAAGLAAAFSTGLMAIRAMRETSTALQGAQQEIEQQRNRSFGKILSWTYSVPIWGSSSSSFGDGTTVVEYLNEDLVPTSPTPTDRKKVSVSVAWVSGDRRSMRVSLATMIANGGIDRQ